MRTLVLAGLLLAAPAAGQPHSPFDHSEDVGAVTPPGVAAYDEVRDTYVLKASGANLWGKEDAFHFLWKQGTGDFSLTADIAFMPPGYGHEPNPHRKALLMIRASSDADAAYADVAVHGNGLTALQYRREKGGVTEDIELNIPLPKTVRLEKRGDTLTMLVSQNGEPLHAVGAAVALHFAEPYLVGLGLTAHDATVSDMASFSHVRLAAPEPEPAGRITWSALKTLKIDPGAPTATVIAHTPGIFEAPNWAPDGKSPNGQSFVINENGRFWRVASADGSRQPFDTGGLKGCWGEHAFSPDGKWFALSCPAAGEHGPDVHIIPASGGTARRLTAQPVSFFHGWSPDGSMIVFTSIRDGHEDIYTVPVAGGTPQRLTATGLNDGGEYSADGKFLYFNSNRSGTMQIWRMAADGSDPVQLTDDGYDNWYPHPSPDGKWLAVLSYAKGEATANHPMDKDVVLRLIPLAGGNPRILTHLTGGQGTFDSPCWSEDSQMISFVSYDQQPPE
jgi:Tol biopolymer transport system component